MSIPLENNGLNPTYQLMCKRYGKYRLTNFPKRFF